MTDVNLPNTSRSDSDANLFSDVTENDIAIRDVVNGNLTNGNIKDGAAIDPAKIDFSAFGSGNGIVTAGKSIVATEQTTTSTSYTTLSTPDTVASIVLPTDGLIFVSYRALVKSGGGSGVSMALFLGANQLTGFDGTVAGRTVTSSYQWVTTTSVNGNGGFVGTGLSAAPVTTGQEQGGVLVVEAAAGTYDVSVRFKCTADTASAKNRKLRVWSQAY